MMTNGFGNFNSLPKGPMDMDTIEHEIAKHFQSMGMAGPSSDIIRTAMRQYKSRYPELMEDQGEPPGISLTQRGGVDSVETKTEEQLNNGVRIYKKNRDTKPESVIPHLQDRQKLVQGDRMGLIPRPEPFKPGDIGVFQLFNGGPTYCSTKELNDLNIIGFQDLQCPRRHDGTVLICRILTKCVVGSGFSFQMEDPTGKSMPLTVMNVTITPASFSSNHLRDHLYPVGAILAIKEPYIKFGVSGGIAIRSDVPKDIVIVHPKDSLFKDIRWAFDAASNCTFPAAREKEKGNVAMKACEYLVAVRHYTSALTDPTADLSTSDRVILLLNRSQAHINLGNFGSAYRDCVAVRAELDSHADFILSEVQQRKLKWRLAKSTYGLRCYDLADQYATLAAEIGVEESKELLLKVEDRKKEASTGEYNWSKLYTEMQSRPDSDMDVADYQGPVETVVIQGKGRGLRATRELQAGDLLLVSKAIVHAYPSESKGVQTISINSFLGSPGTNGLIDGASHAMCVTKAVHQLSDNPGMGAVWDGLFPTNKLHNSRSSLPFPLASDWEILNNMNSSYPINPLRVEGILTANAFAGHAIAKVANTAPPPSEDIAQLNTKTTVLFSQPSMANHSCTPNATPSTWSNVAVVRALHHIPKGGEVFLNYFPCDSPYVNRKERADAYEFKCECPVCVGDSSNVSLCKQRERLMENEFPRLMDASRKALTSGLPPSSIRMKQAQRKPLEDMRSFLGRLEALYEPGRDKGYKYECHAVWRAISDHLSVLDPQERIKAEIQGLESIGTVMATKKQRAQHGRTVHRFGQAGGEGRVICLLQIAQTYSISLNDMKEATAWARTAYWVDQVILGAGLEVFKSRYAAHLQGLAGVTWE